MELIGSLYPLDLALLPVGGFFTMDGLQAAHAARLLKPKAVIPMHWGDIPGPCEGHLGLCVASRFRGSRCPPGLHEAR